MMQASTVDASFPRFKNHLSRLKRNTLLFRYFAIINLIIGLWYLQWRFNNSINFNLLWLSIPLLLAEIYSYINGSMFILGLWRPIERQVKPLDHLTPAFSVKDLPTVDVFITCYSEPVELVQATLEAALQIDYPATKLRVYVLDDGNSPDMKAMVEQRCAEDLAAPELVAAAEQLQAEQTHLQAQLDRLTQLAPEAQAAEAFLDNPPNAVETQEPDRPLQFLQVLHKLLTFQKGQHSSISEQLIAEEKRLKQAIARQNYALSNLPRCLYIARPKPTGRPHHAKAGNINYALFAGGTTGDFILTLDADHIPDRKIVKHVLPYFFTYNPNCGKYESNRIAIVQTPQDFYNLPKGDPFGHRAHLFYGPIQQGKDGFNAAFYTGTNAVLRREALVNTGLKYFSKAYEKDESRLDEFDFIGGVSSISITEDMNTAMRLHAAGWQSIYHNEVLAKGLAPDDLSSTLKQRLRWAQGTIQVLLQENPWTKPGLTFWQQLQYFQTMYSYFSGFATFIFLLCPIVYFFTGGIPVDSYGLDFALHFTPAFILNRITFLTIAWGVPASELWRSEQYAVALFPLFIQAVWSVITHRPIKFQVTPKQRQSGIYLNLVMPQLIIFGLTAGGIVWRGGLWLSGQPIDIAVYGLNIAWSMYNLALLWGIIRAAIWQPKKA
ncbi:glycosyltransferase family 2 protein [Alkalinema sp. FACHB-956]|uniref:glycosyltransferase family 2 protein n=1 Tax=Alkalinema sp. FACHB-956 TaxID=2692768 RepID=UPI0016849124|nr:glycosyltransferase family 2 protein [Alkalinema sp. FACHB-956]MBD2326570.1 glycosyltransferase [Alkalinema sp. FACHB-956]